MQGQDRTCLISKMVSNQVRPAEIEDRQFPGHWVGGLIKGKANVSAVDTKGLHQPLSDVDQPASGQASQCAHCVAGF